MKKIFEQIDKWLREANDNQSKYAFTCPKAFHRGEISAYNKVRVLLQQRHLTSRRSRAADACANCEWRPTKPGWKCLTTDCEYYPPPA